MKKMRNRLLSSILVLAMVISWLPGNFLQAEAAEETQLYGVSTGWTEWSGEAFHTTAGKYCYKLTEDVDLTNIGVVTIPADVTVAIDLCGNKIQAQAGSRSFSVEGTLIIQDSSEEQTGQVVGSTIAANGGNIYLKNGAVLELYSGTITGGTARRGGNIYVSDGTFNMYGGTITRGTADNTLGTGKTDGRGGNIFSLGNVYISGGTVTGGTTNEGSSYGGNIYMTNRNATLYISGSAQVTKGEAKNGGNIYAMYSNVNISGGTVSGGLSTGNGSDIYTNGTESDGYSTLTISGGTVAGNLHLTGKNSGSDYRTVVQISGGNLKGETYAAGVRSLTLTGAPVIENLRLPSGTRVTLGTLVDGASVTVDASDTVISDYCENAANQAQYFKAAQLGNLVKAVEGVLQIIVGCPCGCEKALEEAGWQDWSGEAITKSGHYRLSGSFTLDSTVTVTAKLDVVLDLNGKELTAHDGECSFEVSGRLRILDSSEAQNGKLVGKTVAGNGGNVFLNKGAVLDLYSGTITGGTVTGGKTDYGGNIYMEGGTFNMYGGKVTGGTADRGGNIYLDKGTARISGGEITDGRATWGGGNLFVKNMSTAIYISGGTVSGGSTKNGGICSQSGNLHISGGTVQDDIYVTRSNGNNAALYISGGIIYGNITTTGASYSGDSHVIEISGGKLTGTTYIKTAKTMILSGAPVIKNLILESGVLVTPGELSAADITIDATGVFTTALEDAESYIDIFKYSGSDKKYMVHQGALALFEIVASGNCGDGLKWELTDTGVLIISGDGAMNDVTNVNEVPWSDNKDNIIDVVIEHGVTSIGAYAFYECQNIKSVTIADTVIGISKYAFYGCAALTEVVLPDVLTSLGIYAFYGCSSLKRIVIPDGITTISDYAFRDCTGLTEVTLPANVETIGSNAFRNCTGLTEVILPESVESIGANAFNGSALTNVYYKGAEAQWNAISGLNNNNTILTTLAANGHVHYNYVAGGGMTGSEVHWKLTEDFTLTIFGEGAMGNYYYDTAKTEFVGTPWWQYANEISTVKVEPGVTSVGDWAFYGLTKLTSVTLAGNVTRIGNHAFRGCTALTQINLPASVTQIGRNAFQGCTGLTDFNCTSAETLGAYAFYGCTGLTVFTVPETMTAIGEHAFDGCDALTAFTVEAGNTAYRSDSGVLYNVSYETDEIKITLVRAPGGITGSFTVPESVTDIGAGAFAGCDKLTEVSLPDTVKELAAAAFDGCAALQKVTLGSGTTSIDSNVFANCGSLTEIIVPEENTDFASDGAGALYNNDMTTLVQVPGGTAGIYSVAEGVTTVGQSAFAGNKGITMVRLPSSVTTVDKWAFSCSENLAKITLPSDVPSILVGAFEHTGLTDVYYQGDESQWGDETVEGYNDPLLNATVYCLLIAEDTIEGITWKLTTDGVLTFTGNGGLTYDTAENVPWYSHREIITQVVFSEGITSVGSNILNGCTELKEVTIPDSVTEIGDNAFAGCEALTDVYYSGSRTQWSKLPVGEGNQQLRDADIHCDFVELVSITVKTLPTKKQYYLNEALDPAGFILTVVYDDGSTRDIAEGYDVSYDFTRPGSRTVTVTYQGVEISYDVTVIPGGSCGEGLSWLFNEKTGTLTVTGTGTMTDYDDKTPAPWSILAEQITALVLDKGINAIGANAFSGCSNLQKVTYGGTAMQWDAVKKAAGNEPLDKADLTCAVLLGDADGNGVVTGEDAVKILWYVADSTVDLNIMAADVNGDGSITGEDAVRILWYVADPRVPLG